MLEKRIFVVLSSTKYVIVTIATSILNHTISDQIRYLVANMQDSNIYGLSTRHISYQYGVVEINLQNVEENQKLFIDIDFMIEIFSEAKLQLSPFKYFLEDAFEK